MKKKPPPDLARIRELVSYSPETGELRWAKARSKCKPGNIAGYRRRNGDIYIVLDAVKYSAARIIWFMVTETWPIEIDHEDCNSSNNRWVNLRECDHGENLCNRRMKPNKVGRRGVYNHQGKFRARLTKNGRMVRSGMFDSPDEAHSAWCLWAKEIHGQFARTQ